jgi:hypothetical protein
VRERKIGIVALFWTLVLGFATCCGARLSSTKPPARIKFRAGDRLAR